LRELERAENPECALDRVRILELANKAHSLYVTQTPQEKAKMLRMVLSNCAVDAVSVYPTYRKPFDMIFERAKTGEWWAWVDLNHQPRRYQEGGLRSTFASILPSCKRVQKKAAVHMYNGLDNHCHGESYCLASRWSRRFAFC
jgi:hypothetical protein